MSLATPEEPVVNLFLGSSGPPLAQGEFFSRYLKEIILLIRQVIQALSRFLRQKQCQAGQDQMIIEVRRYDSVKINIQ
jgi:hypothetical protein